MTRIGEIIETSTVGFWAESVALHALPPLGSLVTVSLPEGGMTVGVVAFGQTTGIDEGRRAVRRGDAEVFDSAIYDRHPELTRILRTTFRVVTVGYLRQDGTPRHHLPPIPPPLHYSVSRCDQAITCAFTDEPRYFATLEASVGEVTSEQLLAAHIRAVTADRGNDEAWRAAAGRQVARLLKRDYDRLITVLEAIDPGQDEIASLPQLHIAEPAPMNGHGHKNGVSNRFSIRDDFDDVPFD